LSRAGGITALRREQIIIQEGLFPAKECVQHRKKEGGLNILGINMG